MWTCHLSTIRQDEVNEKSAVQVYELKTLNKVLT